MLDIKREQRHATPRSYHRRDRRTMVTTDSLTGTSTTVGSAALKWWNPASKARQPVTAYAMRSRQRSTKIAIRGNGSRCCKTAFLHYPQRQIYGAAFGALPSLALEQSARIPNKRMMEAKKNLLIQFLRVNAKDKYSRHNLFNPRRQLAIGQRSCRSRSGVHVVPSHPEFIRAKFLQLQSKLLMEIARAQCSGIAAEMVRADNLIIIAHEILEPRVQEMLVDLPINGSWKTATGRHASIINEMLDEGTTLVEEEVLPEEGDAEWRVRLTQIAIKLLA
jgi:hypothetical protein